jgi:hypothetical protein
MKQKLTPLYGHEHCQCPVCDAHRESVQSQRIASIAASVNRWPGEARTAKRRSSITQYPIVRAVPLIFA